MAKGLFSYGQGKRKLGHSKFDQSFNTLSTDNFGALSTKAVFETLPDDFWYIGQNALTKVKPMVAPPFTRIHQNWYAFYVRNQQIWKDWNNYITNGTAWGDVYGSNIMNQNRNNPWQVPQLSMNDLQLPLKIANGYALPVIRLELNWDQINTYFGFSYSASNVTFYNFEAAAHHPGNFLINYILSLRSIFLPYVSGFIGPKTVLMEVGGSYAQLEPLLAILYPDRQSIFRPGTTFNGHTIEPAVTDNNLLRYITYRLFSDQLSEVSNLSNSIYYHTKNIHHSAYDGLDLYSYDYHPRITKDVFLDLGFNTKGSIPGRHFTHLVSDFLGVDVTINTSNQTNDVIFFPDFDGDNNYYYSFQLTQDQAGIHSDSFLTDCERFIRKITPYFGVTTPYYYDFYDGFENDPSTSGRYSRRKATVNSSYPIQSLFDENVYSLGTPCSADVLLPISVDSDHFDTDLYTMYAPFMFGPQSALTNNMGYFGDAWLVYLCKQVSRHLDNFNYPIDALSARSTQAYRFQFINALPFFAYSKIWNDHFRNKALSSPELDFSYANGYACLDSARSSFILDIRYRPFHYPEPFDSDFSLLESTNGWALPLCMLPKNSLPQDYTDLDGFRHFISSQDHYYTVESYMDLFSLLTGASLDTVVLKKQFRSFITHYTSAGAVDYTTFSSLYAQQFYLPSYYNGLLHLKYQNFNSDYFTTGLLDPMSGANQVELGSTVNELRVNETKQSWFEKIVNSRSISGFMRTIFGIDPIVDDNESRMLGSDHIDINIGEVIQTSQTDNTPQGTRSGLGQAHGKGSLVHNHANEHGWIIIVCSHTIESQYMQGLEKQYFPKSSYMDYPTQDFENIGNESILQKEICYEIDPTLHSRTFDSININLVGPVDLPVTQSKVKYNGQGNPVLQRTTSPTGQQDIRLTRNIVRNSGTSLDSVFAYNMRFSTYKFKLDQCHGEFRNRLRFWQTFRQFSNQPILSHEFINWELLADSEELNRIFAVTDDEYDDKFLLDVFINASVDRALSYISVPHSK